MIERQVIDKIVTFDGSMDAVKDIAKLVQGTKYDVEFSHILPGAIFKFCTFYINHGIIGGKETIARVSYNEAGDYDSVIFHADGSINVIGMLPKCYEEG